MNNFSDTFHPFVFMGRLNWSHLLGWIQLSCFLMQNWNKKIPKTACQPSRGSAQLERRDTHRNRWWNNRPCGVPTGLHTSRRSTDLLGANKYHSYAVRPSRSFLPLRFRNPKHSKKSRLCALEHRQLHWICKRVHTQWWICKSSGAALWRQPILCTHLICFEPWPRRTIYRKWRIKALLTF